MSSKDCDLAWHRISGSAKQIGLGLGRQGFDAVHRHLISSPNWHVVNKPVYAGLVERMSAATKMRFPQIWAEIEGLAEGLELPVKQVMAWNCRGDLLASSPDGCTTVQIPGPQVTIGHNEDGLPFFRGACFIAEVNQDKLPSFWSFCYPGSLPGHTFGVAQTGLCVTANNLRLSEVDGEIPRMVLGRAILSAPSLPAALSILEENPAYGGFHFTLAQVGRPELVSVEFGGGKVSVKRISTPSLHANHALHLSNGSVPQIVTSSSIDRQLRGDSLLSKGSLDPLKILQDTGGQGLPIRRDAVDDPDHENTLATVILHVGQYSIDWSIYDRITDQPAYSSEKQFISGNME